MKILIVGATHGNELLGPRFYRYLLDKRSLLLEHIDFIIGNPRAYAENVRYTDTDLNRCYEVSNTSYESMRAEQIKNYIALNRYDIVLDMHTTSCVQDSSVIVSSIEGKLKKRFLRSTHVKNVVVMPRGNDIVSHVSNSIAYEIYNGDITESLFKAIEHDIERFIDDGDVHISKMVYEIKGKILKTEISENDASALENFNLSKFGYIPFLTGNNSYKSQTNYLGFKMQTPREIKV